MGAPGRVTYDPPAPWLEAGWGQASARAAYLPGVRPARSQRAPLPDAGSTGDRARAEQEAG
jgi:hypothetical protein